MRGALASAGMIMIILLVGCTPDPGSPVPDPTLSGPSTASGPPSGTPSRSRVTPTPSSPSPSPPRARAEVSARRMVADVQRLAGDIGPREATSKAFHEAADLVEERFRELGFRTRRTAVKVPAGDSWGTPVRAGTSANVIADTPGLDPARDHVVIGAHLDTVARAPGAEDNASGIAVLLELARLAGLDPPEVPIRFVAFGAEEPRGDGDALHHFGSRQLVAGLSTAERSAIRGMVSLDRVGVPADRVPVCRAGSRGTALQDQLRDAGRAAKISTRACEDRASDHWSYQKAGIPAVRLGKIAYAGYHSPDDVPSVVDDDQLARAARLLWSWLGRS
ncbi:M28 family metallopeptidase [Microlunatus sp. GCM10028923]|uniref:M28 family metallopeptidase n=1 Tax=Microlunatus sp. GCM10028923 TaxID=3273400 RepID=UPI0036164E55